MINYELGQSQLFYPQPLYQFQQFVQPEQPAKKKVIVKKYSEISDEQRRALIQRVLELGMSVKKASTELGLKLSTSKAILKTFKKDGRIGKKKERIRKSRKPRTPKVKQLDPMQVLMSRLPKLASNQKQQIYKSESSYMMCPPMFSVKMEETEVKIEQ